MSHLFSTLEPIERQRVLQLLAPCRRATLRAGDVLGHGDLADASLLLAEVGIVVVTSAPRANRRVLLGLAVGGMVLAPPRYDERLTALVHSALISVTAELGTLEREGFLVRNGRSYLLPIPPDELGT